VRFVPALDRLRDEILSGRLGPGERLVELHLSERLAVSRAAIRSALQTLESEGLVVRLSNRGATVRRVSVAEAIEITEARAALETLIARQAAARATPADAQELRSVVAAMRKAVAGADLSGYSELNGRFHACVRRIAKHDVADELVRNLRHRAASHAFRLALIPGRPAQSLGQHEAISDAIARADPEAAGAAMADHLASVIDALRHWDDLDVAL
jgi:DNA-binding GntR family transcriptional regulator